ncbi:LacI family DNA-binding transcriptional regulator [Oerskovia flava]|uniref:LacI family DNA-binding transcriptional regulator n=1 Tax=Oerskovia flava TaxID=2986422 RepID=UPI002AD29484|nr:LacI family DNA-binding transcriptional regulator [Oerskovia sp. JB1-3-2]
MTSLSREVGDLSGLPEQVVSGKRRARMRDVAELAGVGIKTVSRVVNGERDVSPATSEKVLAAIERLGYRPDVYAGNLRRSEGRTRTLGLLVSSVANPFASLVHRGVEEVANERGVAVFAASLDEDPAAEPRKIDAFLRRRVDGLILTTIRPDQSYLAPERDRGTPMVFVDRIPHGIDADAVVCDNAEGAAAATRHLVQHGHRRIAFLGDLETIETARARREGFLAELARAGIAAQDAPVITDLQSEEAAEDAVRRLFTRAHPPTAIFSAQNIVTNGTIRALRATGMSHQVALVGFDDISLGDLLDPPVTVVAQDPLRIGRLAAERLFARLDGDVAPASTTVVRTRLVVRGSGEIHAPVD